MKKFVLFASVIMLIALTASIYESRFGKISINPSTNTPSTTAPSVIPKAVEVITMSLEVPWAIAFLPNKDILFTERTGSLKKLSNGQVSSINKFSDVKVYGEGGLLGLALDPEFDNNHQIFLYYTYSGNGNNTLNRVVRYKYQNNKLTDRKILIDKIPGAVYHNGGRLKFGPDEYLYITTGDSLNPSLAQNKNSLAGKILRITTDGKPAPGNPFNNLAYSYGHRNPQGLAWDNQGRLWETEHGNSATDEVNLIIKGANYGWPTIIGRQTRAGMQSPFAQSGAETWAPAGAVFLNNSLYYGGLKGEALFELKVENGNAIITKHLLQQLGRIRDVEIGPNNLLYITTSNRDGRGVIQPQDDKIIRVDPTQL